MKTVKLIMAFGAAALVSACADTNQNTASRNVGLQDSALESLGPEIRLPDAMSLREIKRKEFVANLPDNSPMRVDRITVVVPDKLTVSEKNSYLPRADIVWRDDPIGNRHTQVEAIFRQAFANGTASMTGEYGVSIHVEVMRFHAITEKARYSIGGVHDITFGLAIRDTVTGQFVMEPKVVNADLEAFGGRFAVEADARGETQKVRITNHLAEVIRQELSTPNGFVNPRLGFVQSLNGKS